MLVYVILVGVIANIVRFDVQPFSNRIEAFREDQDLFICFKR